MALFLTINGVDRSGYVDFSTLLIQDSVRAKTDTLTVDLVLPAGDALISTFNQLAGREIIFTDGAYREFGGVVQKVRQTWSRGSGLLRYTLSCADYTVWLDRHLLNADIPGAVVGEMVKFVINNVNRGAGFTYSNVNASTITLPDDQADYELPSAVLDRLAQMVEHLWYIDYYKDLHFFPREYNAAPVTILDLDVDYRLYSDFAWEEDVTQYKNVLFLKDYLVKLNVPAYQEFKGDGITKYFPLLYQPTGPTDTDVTVGGTAQSVVSDDPNEDLAGRVYLNFSDAYGLRFPTANIPGNGVTITVSYDAYSALQIGYVVETDSVEAMRARSGNSDGQHEIMVSAPDRFMEDQRAVEEWARIVLSRYKDPIQICSFRSTYKGAGDHWRAGQYFIVSSTSRGIASIFYITSVTKRILTPSATGPGADTYVQYSIEASSTPWGL